MLPYAPTKPEADIRHHYQINTQYVHMVAEYANMTIPDVMRLDVIDFLVLRRDAVISAFSRTENGVEYLNHAWNYEQTDIDREALRESFGITRLE